MKKRMLNFIFKGTLFVALPFSLVSCIGYYGVGYEDGIYGEAPVRPAREYTHYETAEQKPQHSYKAYLQEKANAYNAFEQELRKPSYTPFTDVNNYRTTENQGQTTYNSYGGWGDNAQQSSVIVYNNYGGWGYNPYWDWNYRHSYYWGMGSWYPYGNYYYPHYGYNYYRPYRGWGFSIGSYDPYWYGGYYGYYGRYYSPYYYDYYYSPYYYGRGYYDRGYYGYQHNRDYQGRRYSPTGGRRGDSNRYESYSRQNQNLNSRSYTSPYNGDSYSRSYHQNNRTTPSTSPYRNDSSSRSYNSGSYDNSSRSYNSNSGSSGGGGFSGTRRNF